MQIVRNPSSPSGEPEGALQGWGAEWGEQTGALLILGVVPRTSETHWKGNRGTDPNQLR